MAGMSGIPAYPHFAPVSLDTQELLRGLLSQATAPLSEYTFGSLFVFRHKYHYQVALTDAGDLLISGVHGDPAGDYEKFFMTPLGIPERDVIVDLFRTHDYWRGITPEMIAERHDDLAQWGVATEPDPADFDYLHLRSDLAELRGDKYQKKRNQIHSFEKEYDCVAEPLGPDDVADARSVLDVWRESKGSEADYLAAIDALELQSELGLIGRIYRVQNLPVGWWLGEYMPQYQMFVEHFEKGSFDFPGVYQFINRDMAASLPGSTQYINREQDLGDEGLRQAKASYHPIAFVEKYVGTVRR